MVPEPRRCERPSDRRNGGWDDAQTFARRIATRYRNKAVKLAEAKKEPKQESKTEAAAPAPLDYAQLAFLAANGIKEPGEIALVEAALKNSGKELKELLGAKWFQAELQEARDDAASKAATPKGSDRSTPSGKDTVDHPPRAHDDLANAACGALWLCRAAADVPLIYFIDAAERRPTGLGGFVYES